MRLVVKFGGTSVGSPERIFRAAERLLELASENQVVAVVSAMGSSTDELEELALSISRRPSTRELDLLLATGEQQSAALLAMCINGKGGNSRAITGWQAGIHTDNDYGNAWIERIDPQPLDHLLQAGYIPIVTGFQGIHTATGTGEITTFGRGGSDLTAVAIADAIDADRCQILTDVDGVFTSDPRVVSGARKLERVSMEEMLELAILGAQVMCPRAVRYARRNKVTLEVASSFHNEPGTQIIHVTEEDIMEMPSVSSISLLRKEALVTITDVADKPGAAAALLQPVADAGVNLGIIVQNIGIAGRATISFSVPKDELDLTEEVLARETGSKDSADVSVSLNRNIASISIVGEGMRSRPNIASQCFRCLAEHQINILLVTTSDIRITIVIDEAYGELANRLLHEKMELSAKLTSDGDS